MQLVVRCLSRVVAGDVCVVSRSLCRSLCVARRLLFVVVCRWLCVIDCCAMCVVDCRRCVCSLFNVVVFVDCFVLFVVVWLCFGVESSMLVCCCLLCVFVGFLFGVCLVVACVLVVGCWMCDVVRLSSAVVVVCSLLFVLCCLFFVVC